MTKTKRGRPTAFMERREKIISNVNAILPRFYTVRDSMSLRDADDRSITMVVAEGYPVYISAFDKLRKDLKDQNIELTGFVSSSVDKGCIVLFSILEG